VLLVGAGLRIAQTARTDFSRLVATGLTMILGFQAFFIMAGVLRLLPLTGITLPFMAYGGSSLVANYILVALLLRISDEGASTAAEQATRKRAVDAQEEQDALAAALRAAPADTFPHIAALGAEELMSGPGPDRLTWGFHVLINGVLQTPRPEPEATTDT